MTNFPTFQQSNSVNVKAPFTKVQVSQVIIMTTTLGVKKMYKIMGNQPVVLYKIWQIKLDDNKKTQVK